MRYAEASIYARKSSFLSFYNFLVKFSDKHIVIVDVLITISDCKCALVNRKKLKYFNSESIGLPNFKLYFNENLTECNNILAFYGLKLKRAGLINSTYTLNDTMHILRTVGERL